MHNAEQSLGKRRRDTRGRRDMMNQEYDDYVGGVSSSNLPRLTTSLGNPVGEIVPASQPSQMEVEVIDTSESVYNTRPTIDARGTATVDRGTAYNLRSRDVMRTNPYGSRFDEL